MNNISFNNKINNESFLNYSAFKIINHGNCPKFLFGFENNVIFRLIEPDGRLNRCFIGHSHPILDFLQIDENIIASTEQSCLLLWDYREQNPFHVVSYNSLSITSNLHFSNSTIFLDKNINNIENCNENTNNFENSNENISQHKSSNENSNISQNKTSNENSNISQNKTSNENEDKNINENKSSNENRISNENSNQNCMEIGMALSDGRMRFLDLREPKTIKGFSNVVGMIDKFVCSDEKNKLALFCSMPISYWEANIS